MKLSRIIPVFLVAASLCTTSCIKIMTFSYVGLSVGVEADQTITDITTRKVEVYNGTTLVKTENLTGTSSYFQMEFKDLSLPATIKVSLIGEWTSGKTIPSPISFKQTNAVSCIAYSTKGDLMSQQSFSIPFEVKDQPTGTPAEKKAVIDEINKSVTLTVMQTGTGIGIFVTDGE